MTELTQFLSITPWQLELLVLTALLVGFSKTGIGGVMMVVIPFYFGASMSKAYYAKGFFVSVVLLVGLGTVAHSMFDFFLSRLIWSPVNKTLSLKKDKRELSSLVK